MRLTLVRKTLVKPWNNRRLINNKPCKASCTQIPHYDTKCLTAPVWDYRFSYRCSQPSSNLPCNQMWRGSDGGFHGFDWLTALQEKLDHLLGTSGGDPTRHTTHSRVNLSLWSFWFSFKLVAFGNVFWQCLQLSPLGWIRTCCLMRALVHF